MREVWEEKSCGLINSPHPRPRVRSKYKPCLANVSSSTRIWKVRSKWFMLHTLTFKSSLSLSLSLPLSTLETPIMAWALFSPSLNLSLPHTTKTNFNRTKWFTTKTSRAATTTTTTTRTTSIRANAADQKQPKDKDEDTTSGFSPFAFVTDNPSSREAIQLPESPAEDGNVGEMLYVGVLTLTHHFFQLGISQTLLSLINI